MIILFFTPHLPVPFETSAALPSKPTLPPSSHPRSLQPLSFQLGTVPAHQSEEMEGAGAAHVSVQMSHTLQKPFSPAAALLQGTRLDSVPIIAAQQPAEPESSATVDILDDHPVLSFLSTGILPANVSKAERSHIQRRAMNYRLREGKVFRKLGSELREVPPVSRRLSLAVETHERTGHWGAKRTAALLGTTYSWPDLKKTAKQVSHECAHCDRVKASFNRTRPDLHPLSIEGFCYRWSVDLAGPFQPPTPNSNTYVMIAIEHYTKQVEAVPLPNKESATVAQAFLSHVLARYGSCAEVISDNGTEFEGAFHSL
jgi:hypothetical protein